MKKIAVVLSGCGVYDGSEIHEAVFTMLAIDQCGAEAVCVAPDMELAEVDHIAGKDTGARRNVLLESARIARGNIRNIKDAKAAEFDALIFPGGFGAAKNLCDFAMKGANAAVNPEVARIIRETHAAGKPIGAICIAPVIIGKVLGQELAPTLTIGNDAGTAAELEKTGARHQNCAVSDIVVDRKNRIVTTPAYMLANRISQVNEGISKCVREVIAMIG